LPNEPGLDGDPSAGSRQRAVFLSYASEDSDAAQRICESLRAAGIEVWLDQSELRGGDAWDAAIRQQIKACALFIPIISSNSRARAEGYFRLEWKLAVDRSHLMAGDRTFLVPVVIDGTKEGEARVPDKFRDVQWTRLPGGETPAGFVERLLRLVQDEGAVHVAARTPTDHDCSVERPHSGAGRSAALQTWSRPAWLLAATALALLGLYLLADRLLPSKRTEATQTSAPDVQSRAPGHAGIPEKSIAVLPFLDMSEKKDQEYFSDGLSEELINRLSHSQELRVISRTSSFYFKGKPATIAEIAKALGVGYVLEGSVRKSGQALRITAQLIRATDGVHVWSQTYDRRLSDIFKIQDDVAGTVAQALQVALNADIAHPKRHQSNTDAYNLLLEADFFSARETKADTEKAIELYKGAIKLDPNYALAWASLGNAYGGLPFFGSESIPEDIAKARDAVDHALRLDPNLPFAHLARAGILEIFDWDWRGAEAEYARARELDPGDSSIDADLAQLAATFGRLDEAIAASRRDLARDPLSTWGLWHLGWELFAANRYEEAAGTFRRVSELNPSYASAKAMLAVTLLFQGKKTEALAAVEQEPDEAWRFSISPIVYWDLGKRDESDAALSHLEKKYAAGSAYNIAEMRAYRGEINAAADWLDRAYRQRDPGMVWVKIDPMLRNLHSNPRYKALLIRLKLTD
jgi:adenylate cyclase